MQKPPVPHVPPAHGHLSQQSRVHETVPPHPLLTVPLHRFAHGFAIGVQPHAFGPAPPPPHVFGAAQVFGHWTTSPQLFVFGPHATPAHVVARGSG